jgi:hypothetical protein
LRGCFFPETLNSCLSLPYILRFIIIHRVPESSFPPQHAIPPGVINGVWEQHRYRDWWPVLQHYQEGSSFNPVPEERDEYGRFLYNGALYSERPIHHTSL